MQNHYNLVDQPRNVALLVATLTNKSHVTAHHVESFLLVRVKVVITDLDIV